MYFGYNTNGFAHHRLADTLEIIAEIGYDAAAITLEAEHLDPPNQRGVDACVRAIAPLIEATGLRPTIETGARFILDPRRKHQPTLLSAGPADVRTRVELLNAAIDVASQVNADSVSLWSGVSDDGADETTSWNRLTESLSSVLNHAASRGVRLAFEPEPGMFVDTMARFAELIDRVPDAALGLTIDIGHVMCLDDGQLDRHLDRWRDRLCNIHIEDMHRGLHEHLMFGDGEIDFDAVLRSLRRAGYTGPAHVELSRHSHMAVDAARRSHRFLTAVNRNDSTTDSTVR